MISFREGRDSGFETVDLSKEPRRLVAGLFSSESNTFVRLCGSKSSFDGDNIEVPESPLRDIDISFSCSCYITTRYQRYKSGNGNRFLRLGQKRILRKCERCEAVVVITLVQYARYFCRAIQFLNIIFKIQRKQRAFWLTREFLDLVECSSTLRKGLKDILQPLRPSLPFRLSSQEPLYSSLLKYLIL